MCVMTVHFGGRTPNVPDANGGFYNLIEGCYNLNVLGSDIHVVARKSTYVVTVNFCVSTPNVPDAYGGSSHCGFVISWRRFRDFTQNSLEGVTVC